jgi:hypothetical protein
MALTLLHQIIGTTGRGMWVSLNNILNQQNLAIVMARERYLASAIDHKKATCFFAFQETRQSPRKTSNLEVKRWLMIGRC